MTVRNPLYWDDNTSSLKTMTDTEVSSIVSQACYRYSTNPSVVLDVISSGGNLDALYDTRLVAGPQATSVADDLTEAITLEPSAATSPVGGYTRINQVVDDALTYSVPTEGYPVYYESNSIKPFSETDFFDTFIDPAIVKLSSSSTGTEQGGTYRIHTSTSLSGHTLVSSTPVFVDLRAPSGAAYIEAAIAESGYAAGSIELINYLASGFGRVISEVISNFYLFKVNGSPVTYTKPLFLKSSDDNLKAHSTNTFDSVLETAVRWSAAKNTGSKIRYNINGTGNNRGSGMTDTRLNGGGLYLEAQFTVDDYRAQEFPDGVGTVISTYYLRINQE